MAVRYATAADCHVGGNPTNDYPVTAWASTTKVGLMFSNTLTTNHGLSDYGKAILLKWHRQDPVSQKEIDRNAGVEAKQGNRNPFVDYPCLVEYLWGKQVGKSFEQANVLGSFETGFTVGSCDGCGGSTTTPTTTISFAHSTVALTVGNTFTNPATTNSGGTITYSSSSGAVATVSPTGLVCFWILLILSLAKSSLWRQRQRSTFVTFRMWICRI